MTDDKIAKVAPAGALERPSFIPKGDTRGTDHITKNDLQMPRLALGQGLTPQVSEGKDGFTVGVLFNSLTEEIYGKGPIEFTVVRADPPRYVEFIPRDEGGGVRDPNVPPNDPRTKFTMDGNGKPVPPIATKYYDFIIMMLPVGDDPMSNLIALSLKGSGLKVAQRLNALMKLRNMPSFGGRYSLVSAMDKNAKGTFAVYRITNAGNITDEPTYRLAEQAYELLKDKTLVIDREPGDEPDDPATNFNTNNM